MGRAFLALLLWLAAALAVQARGVASVQARLTPDGVHASVSLDRAVTRFAFAPADVVREGDFELLTPGLTLKADEVSGAAPFRRFELRILPMKAERDAKYPAHYRVGDGGVVYAPALVADPAAWRTDLTFQTTPGQVRLPPSGDLSDGFVFIGPAALRTEHRDITVVAPPGTPAWLTERTRTDFLAAVQSFTQALGTRPPAKPTLVITHDEGRTGIVADVTAPGSVTIRFHGAAWRSPDPSAAKMVQSLVLHEAFHLWNGVLVHNGEGTPAWLHEGGAEYASLLAGLGAGAWDEAEVAERLAQDLSRCRSALKARALAQAELNASVRYPCGRVIQWMADLHLRRATAGNRGVLQAWGDVVRIAGRRPERDYVLADFYAAAGFSADRLPSPVRLILEETGESRWARLPAALAAMGAEVRPTITSQSRLQTVMFHLLKQHCPAGQPYGYNNEPDALVLDTAGRCGPLAGEPVVTTVEGRPVREDSPRLYEAVARKCAAGDEVVFGTRDGRTLAARCGQPLPPAPEGYQVTRWRPAASSPGSSRPSGP